MIRFHAPVRSATRNVRRVAACVVVTLETQEHVRRKDDDNDDDDDDPTMRNPRMVRYPLCFFIPTALRMIVVATHDTLDGSSRISELVGFNCS